MDEKFIENAKEGLLLTKLDGEDQWWEIKIDIWNFIDPISPWVFFHEIQKIKDINEWTRIIASPIIDRNTRIKRGKYSNDNPFIVRGKKLSEFFISIKKDTSGIHIYYEPYKQRSLTVGQKKWVDEKFGDQLKGAWSPELIKILKQREIDDQFQNIEFRLKSVLEQTESFLAEIQARKEDFIL